MSTINSNTLDLNNPFDIVSITIQPQDYWDDTNKRPTSGYFIVEFTNLNVLSTHGDDTIRIHVCLPNAPKGYNPYDCAIGFGTDFDVPIFNKLYKIAWNYGKPGPTARINPDGTVSLVDIILKLDKGTSSSGIVALSFDYNITFTEINPYTTLEGASSNNFTMYPSNGAGADNFIRGAISFPGEGSDFTAIQLKTLTTTTNKSPTGISRLKIKNGTKEVYFNSELSPTKKSIINIKDFNTLIIALNDGMPDPNAFYNFVNGSAYPCAFDLEMETPRDGANTISLDYDLVEGII